MHKFTSCYGCKERFVGCHITCEKYLKERNEYEELRMEIAKNRSLDKLHRDYTMQSAIKTSKKWKKK